MPSQNMGSLELVVIRTDDGELFGVPTNYITSIKTTSKEDKQK